MSRSLCSDRTKGLVADKEYYVSFAWNIARVSRNLSAFEIVLVEGVHAFEKLRD